MNKRKLLIIIAFLFLAFSLIQLLTVSNKRVTSDIDQKSLSEKILAIKKETRFLENGCPVSNNQDWVVGKAIGCEASPNKYFVGKFVFNSLYEPERYYELFIMTADGSREWKVFSGDFRTLGWEWIEDNRIKIFYNCGTGCKAIKVIGLDETVLISDYTNGRMNEKYGWTVEFSGL